MTEQACQQRVKGLFFLVALRELLAEFMQALLATGYPRAAVGARSPTSRFSAPRGRSPGDADVMLVSHDRDFAPQMERLAASDQRVGILGFGEFMAGNLRDVEGMEFFDLEYDVAASTSRLPRVRVIPIDEFKPLDFI